MITTTTNTVVSYLFHNLTFMLLLCVCHLKRMPKTLGRFRPCQIWMHSKSLAKALSSLFWPCSSLSLPASHFTPFSTSTLSTSCWLCNSELSIFASIVLSACIDHMPCNSKVHMLFLTLPDSPLYFLGALLIFLAQELNHLF